MSVSPKLRFCLSGKIAYCSQDDALAAARRIGRRSGHDYRPYQCPTCRFWHLTTRPWRKRLAALNPLNRRTT